MNKARRKAAAARARRLRKAALELAAVAEGLAVDAEAYGNWLFPQARVARLVRRVRIAAE